MQGFSTSRHSSSPLETRKRIVIWLKDVWQGKQHIRLPEAAQNFPFASVDVPFAHSRQRDGILPSIEFWCRIVFSEHLTGSGSTSRYDWTLYVDSAYAGSFVCLVKNWVWPLNDPFEPAFARNFVLWGLMVAVDERRILYATRGGLRDAKGMRVRRVADWWDVCAPCRVGHAAKWYRRWYLNLGIRS